MSARNRDTDLESDISDIDSNIPPVGEVSMQEGNVSMNILLDIQSSVKRLDRKFDSIHKTVCDLKKTYKKLKDQNIHLTHKVQELSTSMAEMERRNKETEMKYEKLEAQSRREDLKFFDIEESEDETWDQSELKIRQYITNDLQIDDTDIKIERAHRLPGKTKPRPLIAKFSFYKDKDKILKRYRELRRAERERAPANGEEAGDNEGNGRSENVSKVRVSEDFPDRVRKVRSLLIRFLDQAIKSGKEAYLRYDKLVVNGYSFEYDYVKERPVPVVK